MEKVGFVERNLHIEPLPFNPKFTERDYALLRLWEGWCDALCGNFVARSVGDAVERCLLPGATLRDFRVG